MRSRSYDVGDTALRADEDAVVLVLALEHLLGGRFGEERDRRAGRGCRSCRIPRCR